MAMIPFHFGHRGDSRATGTVEIVAAVLGLLWLIAVTGLVFWGGGLGSGEGGLFAALTGIMAVVMPVAVIGMVAATARHVRALREEADWLRGEIDRLRAEGGAPAIADPSREGLAQAASAPRETAPSRDAAGQDFPMAAPVVPPRAAAPASQPASQPAPAPAAPPAAPVSIDDYIVALNFPDSAEDSGGITALRRVLAHDRAAKLIRAAQDALTLLAQDGIFMDDLPADPIAGSDWRRFARGAGGAALGQAGAFTDVIVLERVSQRMETDQVFRDAAHHFLRQFDRNLGAFAEEAGDEDLAMLGQTRTARAFLLLGSVAGTFD